MGSDKMIKRVLSNRSFSYTHSLRIRVYIFFLLFMFSCFSYFWCYPMMSRRLRTLGYIGYPLLFAGLMIHNLIVNGLVLFAAIVVLILNISSFLISANRVASDTITKHFAMITNKMIYFLYLAVYFITPILFLRNITVLIHPIKYGMVFMTH